MTALLNLDWRNSADERAIPIADLEAGWDEHILPLLSTVRPRIVCALTNRVWNVVAPVAERTRIALPDLPRRTCPRSDCVQDQPMPVSDAACQAAQSPVAVSLQGPNGS